MYDMVWWFKIIWECDEKGICDMLFFGYFSCEGVYPFGNDYWELRWM